MFLQHRHHHISIVFPPPPSPPQPHFHCFLPPPSAPPHFHCFSPRQSIKDCKLLSSVQFVARSQVVKNSRGFLQFLAVCPTHQRQFLLRTASPQQLHALVQLLYNILKEYILIPEENKRNVLPYKDALVNLAETNAPYKTKKRILVQEGDGFIQDLLVPAVTSLGFLML